MIIIDPIDTLFFRDGRPFSIGDQSAAFGIFPPNPSTVFGAIRSGVIAQTRGFGSFCAKEMADEIGTLDEYNQASFKLKGIFLYNRDTDYLFTSAPLDIVRVNETVAVRIPLKDSPPYYSNSLCKTYPFASGQETSESVVDHYITHTNFARYLEGSFNEFDIIPESDFCRIEYKTGIKRNPRTKVTDESNLYRVGMRRFLKKCSLICDVEGLNSLRKDGVLKLGGEGKTVSYDTISFEFSVKKKIVIDRMRKTQMFRLVFTSPALFEKGWIPDDNILKGPDYRLKLLTASLASPIAVGGWDMGKNNGRGGHKTMLRAVPPGSVYYFQIEEGKPETVFDKLNYQNLGQRANEGFGLAFVGSS